jgi:hypothetical protein
MITVPTPVVRSISAGSRPIASQCRTSTASLRRTFSIPPPTLFASAYFATSLSVTRSPPPPISSGSRRWTGGGSFRTDFAR